MVECFAISFISHVQELYTWEPLLRSFLAEVLLKKYLQEFSFQSSLVKGLYAWESSPQSWILSLGWKIDTSLLFVFFEAILK